MTDVIAIWLLIGLAHFAYGCKISDRATWEAIRASAKVRISMRTTVIYGLIACLLVWPWMTLRWTLLRRKR